MTGQVGEKASDKSVTVNDTFDLILAGGTVLNPATKLNQKLDVAVTGDRVAAIQADLPALGHLCPSY